MANTRVTAIGIPTTPGTNGSLPLRREIRELQANSPDQFNLYVLGLAEFQKTPPADLISYYQIAGIHGEPYVPWNGVAGLQGASGGYCTHSSILFLTWHRPYLALYEQALYAAVQKIANRFPDALRARYVAAARNFRMPFWDWASRVGPRESSFPSVVSSPTINVVDVDGTNKLITNPLFSFRFDDKDIPRELRLSRTWSRFPSTVRNPDSNGRSQDAIVSRVLTNESASLRTNVSLLLLSYRRFDSFSDNEWARDERPGEYGSLEDIHNEIHDKIGQGGHMGSLATSSFDPVFWLHHANVDRLWDIWQALNPNAYIIDKVASRQEANFFLAANTRLNGNTELKPFYDGSATRFWNSNNVKYATPFGYAYPETQRWLYSNDAAYQTAVRNRVTALYGANVINNFFANIAPTAKAADPSLSVNFKTASINKGAAMHAKQEPMMDSMGSFAQDAPAEIPVEPIANGKSEPQLADNSSFDTHNQPVESAAAPSIPPAASIPPADLTPPTELVPINIPAEFSHIVKDRTYVEWITNLRTIKHALNQTFRVYVFLGDFNPDAATWPTEYNVVGRFTVLGRDGDTPCAKCQTDRDDELVVTGTVPLTSALLQDVVAGQLPSLEPDVVTPYLERHLHWRVTLFDGSEIPRDQVPGLKVGVVSTDVRIGDDGVPIYSGDYQRYPQITDGRPAGLGAGEEV